MKINNVLDSYLDDVKEELDTSPFEYINLFKNRDFLEENNSSLTLDEKYKLREADKILLNRATEFYEHLKPLKFWGNNFVLTKWWWHLDKIVQNKLYVDIENNKVIQQ
jgi:hypothetical protein